MRTLGPAQNRYALFPLFTIAVVFVMLAPLYWMSAELPPGRPIPQGYENAVLYHRVFPFFDYAFERMRAGALPLWLPDQLCGTPFLANPATAVFQPLSAVFFFLNTEKALAAHAFLALMLMGAGMALFLRGLGVRYASALFGAIAYAFGGAAAAGMSRPDIAAALAWAPLLFWALREYAREYRLSIALIAGLFSALVWLSGNWAVALATHLAASAYAAARAIFGHDTIGPSLPRRLAGLLLAAAVAIGVSAVQWVPALAWAAGLQAPWQALFHLDIGGQFPATFRELAMQLLRAEPDRLPRVLYFGIVALILIPGAFVHAYARFDAFLFTVLLLAAVPLAILGHGIGTTGVLLQALLFPAALAACTLTALGIDRILATTRDPRSPLVWGPLLVMLMLAAAVFYTASEAARGRLILALVLLLPVLVVRVRWISAACAVLLSILLFTDLAIANRNYYQHPFSDAPAVYQRHARGLETALNQALGGRALISAQPLNPALTKNLGMLTPLNIAGGAWLPLTREQHAWWKDLGADAPQPAEWASIAPEAKHPALLNYMAARVIIASDDAPMRRGAFDASEPRLRPAPSGDSILIFANDQALRRAYWVPRWRVAASLSAAMDILVDPAFDPTQECVVAAGGDDLAALAAVVPQTAAAENHVDWDVVSCNIIEESPERVLCEVEANQPGLLVLADSFAPGWKARANGESLPLLQVNGLFRGVPVPAGKHLVEFTYRPRSVQAGAMIALGTLLALAIAGFVQIARKSDPIH